MWCGHVTQTFLPLCLYRCSIVDLVKQGGIYLASRELHVCATFSRGFFWTDLNLWPEDLAAGSVVLLSGRDDMMNARQVQAMLTKAGHIKVNPGVACLRHPRHSELHREVDGNQHAR
jgi:hypothetical protein